MSFSHLTMTLNHELGTQTWSRYGQGVSDYSEWKFPASEFENEQTHTPETQTNLTEVITYPIRRW